MSYQQKYLKYKSKYLALKAQATPMTKNTVGTNLSNLVQLGGSGINSKTNTIEQLTATPSLTEIWGGSFSTKSKTDISNLVNLLNESEDIVTTEFSLTGGSESGEVAQSDSEEVNAEENKDSSSSSSSESASATESSENKSDSEIAKAAVVADSNDDDKKDDSDSEVKETVEGEMSAGGKKKPNSYKKFFFEDSDIVQSSTTSDSELSSFNTSTTEDSDADL